MSLDLAALGSNLVQDDAGIWRRHAAPTHELSFPEDGHGVCFGVEDDSFWHAHRNAVILSALHRAGVHGPVLDVGGGNGAVSRAIEAAGLSAVMLEPGPEGARNARRRGLPTVVCSTLEEAGFPEDAFGAAGLFDVAEHVEDDAALFREVARVLRPGGTLCVTVPAHRWLWSDEDELAGHYRRYSLRSLHHSLVACGFDVRYETYFFSALTAPVFLLRSVPHHLFDRDPDAIQAAAARAHVPSAASRKVMNALLAPELAWIRAGRRMPIGTSCLAIAVKTT